MKTVSIALLSASLLAASPALAQNLLVNGGFDDDSVLPGGFIIYSAGQTIGGGGWTVLGNGDNSGLTVSTTYVEPNILFAAHSGPVSADLTASGNTGFANGLAQAIATNAGSMYNLSFYVGNADGSGNGNYILPSAVSVTIDGVSYGSFSNAATTSLTTNWAQFSFNFTALDSSTLIQFNNATPAADNFAGLDTVSVTAIGGTVPEPATWAMMIGGIGMVGGAMRRRRVSMKVSLA